MEKSPDAPSSGTCSGYHPPQADILRCPLFEAVPERLADTAANLPHLTGYLHAMLQAGWPAPQLHQKLGRPMVGRRHTNIIYPVSEDVLVHILPDPTDSRDFYVPVEPGMGRDFSAVLDEIDARLVDVVPRLPPTNGAAPDRQARLLQALQEIVTVRAGRQKNGHRNGSQPAVSYQKGRLAIDPHDLDTVRYLLVRNKCGLGLLQPFLLDPYIEDISCSGVGPLFVEHKIFGSLKSSIGFSEVDELDHFLIRLSEKIGKPVSVREPVVDASLPDGSRINMVFGSELSKRGSNFTVRKFSDRPMSALDRAELNTVSYEMLAYLSMVIGEGLNVFVAGEAASGKTTTLNALSTFISPNAKIVSIEDTPELQIPHPNWTREVTRGNAKSSRATEVSMFDLLKASLRQRPNEILIGEIRGEEGNVAFQAMQTGHAVMATFHAASVEQLIQRLTGSPINVAKPYIDNLNIVVHQAAVRLPDGTVGRRVISVNEIIGYDAPSDSFSFIEVFSWDPVLDEFLFRGRTNSYMLELKIAPKRGIAPGQKRLVYEELHRRARVLRRLHQANLREVYELYNTLAQAYREGFFR